MLLVRDMVSGTTCFFDAAAVVYHLPVSVAWVGAFRTLARKESCVSLYLCVCVSGEDLSKFGAG